MTATVTVTPTTATIADAVGSRGTSALTGAVPVSDTDHGVLSDPAATDGLPPRCGAGATGIDWLRGRQVRSPAAECAPAR